VTQSELTKLNAVAERSACFFLMSNFYYIDSSYIVSYIVSISSLVRFLMACFPLFTVVCTNSQFVNTITKKLHGGLKTRILFSHVKNSILPTRCAQSKNIFFNSQK